MASRGTFKVTATLHRDDTIDLKVEGRPKTGLGNMGAHTLAWEIYVNALQLGVEGQEVQEAAYRLCNWFHFRTIQQSLLSCWPLSLTTELRHVEQAFGRLQTLEHSSNADQLCSAIESYILHYLCYKNQLPYVVRSEGPRASRGEATAFKYLREMENQLSDGSVSKTFRKGLFSSISEKVEEMSSRTIQGAQAGKLAREELDRELKHKDHLVRSNMGSMLVSKKRPVEEKLIVHLSKLFDEKTIDYYLDSLGTQEQKIDAITAILIEFETWLNYYYFPNIHELFFNTRVKELKLADGTQEDVPYYRYVLSRIIFHKHMAAQRANQSLPLIEHLQTIEAADLREVQTRADLYKQFPQWGVRSLSALSKHRPNVNVEYKEGRVIPVTL